MLSEKDFKKLCDLVYRRAGIAIEGKKYTILGRKIVDMMKKTVLRIFVLFSTRFDLARMIRFFNHSLIQ